MATIEDFANKYEKMYTSIENLKELLKFDFRGKEKLNEVVPLMERAIKDFENFFDCDKDGIDTNPVYEKSLQINNYLSSLEEEVSKELTSKGYKITYLGKNIEKIER